MPLIFEKRDDESYVVREAAGSTKRYFLSKEDDGENRYVDTYNHTSYIYCEHMQEILDFMAKLEGRPTRHELLTTLKDADMKAVGLAAELADARKKINGPLDPMDGG